MRGGSAGEKIGYRKQPPTSISNECTYISGAQNREIMFRCVTRVENLKDCKGKRGTKRIGKC